MAKCLIAFLALLAACVAFTHPLQPRPPAWPTIKGELATLDDVEAAAVDFPNSSGMQRRRLGAALEAGDKAVALDALRRLAAMGATLSPTSRAKVAGLVGVEAVAPVVARFDANANPLGLSQIHMVIPATHRLIEGLIWDSRAARLYGTSVVDRRLLALVPPAGVSVVAEGGLGSLFGGAYDRARGRIWIASAIIEQTPAGDAFRGLVSFDPTRRGALTRIPVPVRSDATLGDVAVAADGTVYASDGLKGGVYRCRPGCATLEAFVAPGRFHSSQGMAVSPDQKWLYVADYRYGLAAVERASGRILRVVGDADMMLDGIDGLSIYRGDLIAIQNGIGPIRIVRLHLSASGGRIERLIVLERGNPGWGEPSLGVVIGDRFVYVADPQWERYEPGGVAAPERPARSTPIRTITLR